MCKHQNILFGTCRLLGGADCLGAGCHAIRTDERTQTLARVRDVSLLRETVLQWWDDDNERPRDIEIEVLLDEIARTVEEGV